MSYVIRRYEETDKSQVFQLFEDVWGKEKAEKTKRIWNWKYEDNPCNLLVKPIILALESDKKIVSFVCGFPVSLKVKDKLLTAFWGADYLTHPKHQGRGSLLMRKMLREPHLFLDLPNPASYPIVKVVARGSKEALQPLTLIKVINFENILKRKFQNRFMIILGGVLWKMISTMLSIFNRPLKDEHLSLSRVYVFDETIDRFWQKVSQDYNIIMVRDKKYLNWRFIAYPGNGYKVYIAKRNGEISGYIVFRDEEINGLRQGHIVDVLTKKDDKETFQALVQKAIDSLKKEKIDLITCFISPYHRMYKSVLRKNGFIFKRCNYKLMELCKFEPSLEPYLQNPRNWFITKADSDIDMP